MDGLDSKNGDEKRRHMSSKSRRATGNEEEGEGFDGSWRRRSSNENRNDSRMNKQEKSSTLEKLSSWYEDGELENKREGGDRKKSTSKFLNKGQDDDMAHGRDRDFVCLEKDKIDQEKDRQSSELGRIRRRRWDDSGVMSSSRYSDCGPFPQGPRINTMSNRNFSGLQGARGSRGGRGGIGRPGGRDSQQPYGVPVPIMPPPGPMSQLNPSIFPVPMGPPMLPNIFTSPFPPAPVTWPRGIDMNLSAARPGPSPLPPRPGFPSIIGNPPKPAMFSNQPGFGRGEPPKFCSLGVNAMVPVGRGTNQDKEQNDYSQNFVDTGKRPQNFIRDSELTSIVDDYPKRRELIQKKDEIVANASTAPMYFQCDLRKHVLSPEFFGTKFDVILVDPPLEEYVHRAPGVTDHMDSWTFEEIMNLKIEEIADTPSFIFLWVGNGVGLEQGRECLKKWGFRRCEDICWVKTNKTNAAPGLRHDSQTLFQRSKEHCLMGIKGTIRRSTDGHVVHANIDTDIIISEEPPYGSTAKPEDLYRIIEHFALGRRRLELFGEDHNIRFGWLTIGKGLSSSNFNKEAYTKSFADKDGKVWQGSGGRNPPPEAPHLISTTPDIEALRPKSPKKYQHQLQQQSASATTASATFPTPEPGPVAEAQRWKYW